MKKGEQIILDALQMANPLLADALSTVRGESESNLGIYVAFLVEAGYCASLVLQEPDYYCPTGKDHTDIAIKLVYGGDAENAPQMNGLPVLAIEICPEHIAPILSNSPTWPINHVTEVVIFDSNTSSKYSEAV